MSVPTSVQSLLSKQNVHYQVSEVPVTENERALWHDQHLRTMSAAKSVILQDGKGRVQVIFAADRLLDLKAVNRQLSRELHAAKPEDVHKFCVSHNLQSIPALPKLAGLLTLIGQVPFFFGQPAYTMTLAARLTAMAAGTVMVFAERLPAGRGFHLHFIEPEVPVEGDTAQRVEAINRNVEALVRRYPAQYIWGYKRYKCPPGVQRPAPVE